MNTTVHSGFVSTNRYGMRGFLRRDRHRLDFLRVTSPSTGSTLLALP